MCRSRVGQGQDLAVDLRVAPVEEHPQPFRPGGRLAAGGGLDDAVDPPPDRLGPGQDLADMDGLRQHVIDAGIEQDQRLLQGALIRQGDHRGAGMLADDAGAFRPLIEIPEDEALHRIDIPA